MPTNTTNHPGAPILVVVPKYTPGRFEPSSDYTFPIGLAYVASSLLRKGLPVEALNLNHLAGTPAEILKGTLDRKPFSVVCTGGNSLIFNELREIIAVASSHPSHPATVLGGIVVTSEPDVVFEAIRPDYAIMGEGEDSAPALFSELLAGNRPESIPGTIFSKDGRTVKTPVPPTPKDIDSIPFPELDMLGYNEWLDNLKASCMCPIESPRPYPLLGSRGCPFKCTFCFHYERHRERSLDSVFTELEAAVPKYRINFIGLYDDCFSLNMGRLKDFCARIRGLQEKTPWKLHWAVQLTVKKLSPEILRLLKDSGCISISFGFESFSQPVLKSMRKPIATQEIETALKLTLQHGLIVQANFIFGDVAETPATYAETLDFWKRSCQGQVNLDIIRLYPGSAIYEQSVRRGIIKDRLAFLERGVSSPVPVNFTAGMSDQQYLQMLRDVFEARRRHGVFVLPRPAKNAKGNYRVSLKCPFCGAKFKVDNIAITTKLWGTSFASFHCACWKCSRRFIAMSLLGFVWMKSKSLRYRLAKFLGPAIAQRLPPLSKGLELPP